MAKLVGCLPEMATCCHLTCKNGETRQDGAVVGARRTQLQDAMEVAAQQVQLCGL